MPTHGFIQLLERVEKLFRLRNYIFIICPFLGDIKVGRLSNLISRLGE